MASQLYSVHYNKLYFLILPQCIAESSQTRMRSMSFLDVALAKALAAGLAHDTLRRQESLTSPPDNYFVLFKDPKAWKQFKEDGRKENLVFCMEFIDENMSSRVFVDLAREFDSIPFVRVQVGQGIERSFEEVYGFLNLFDRTFNYYFIHIIGSEGYWRCTVYTFNCGCLFWQRKQQG